MHGGGSKVVAGKPLDEMYKVEVTICKYNQFLQ